MKLHISIYITLGLIVAAFGWMAQPRQVETWSAVVEINGEADRIDFDLSLSDCMERLGEVEKSFPVVEVTYCEKEG